MQVFGHSYECYAPDSQLIFPCIFLRGVDRLPRLSKRFKKCFELMKQYCDYRILQAVQVDFEGIIMNNFRIFLGDIESEIRKAQRNRSSKQAFYRGVDDLLRAKGYGDLIYYWEAMREKFWSYISLNPKIVNKKMIYLAIEMIEKFYEINEELIIKNIPREQKKSDQYYTTLDEAQKSGELKSSANSSDLMILADSIMYVEERLEHGLLYLVTGDRELFKAASEIVEKPYLIYPDIESGALITGFRPLEPERFIRGIKAIQT